MRNGGQSDEKIGMLREILISHRIIHPIGVDDPLPVVQRPVGKRRDQLRKRTCWACYPYPYEACEECDWLLNRTWRAIFVLGQGYRTIWLATVWPVLSHRRNIRYRWGDIPVTSRSVDEVGPVCVHLGRHISRVSVHPGLFDKINMGVEALARKHPPPAFSPGQEADRPAVGVECFLHQVQNHSALRH